MNNAAPIILYNLRRSTTQTVIAETYSFNEKAETMQSRHCVQEKNRKKFIKRVYMWEHGTCQLRAG